MTDREFERIVRYIGDRYGIDLSQKRVIIAGRLDNYLANNNYKSYDEYMNKVEADATGVEAQHLINTLTTNHTYFMREPEHFKFLYDVALPQAVKRKKNIKDLRIWCAAASSGEEPYTLAMIVKEFLGLEYSMWDSTILATDVSVKVLKKAVAGIYSREQIESIPDRWVRANFKKLDDQTYQVKQELKEQVLFREFNLMNPLPFKKKLDIVFLRNVMIYFDEDTKRALIDRIYEFMEPGGYLFIGATENIDRDATKFKYVRPSVFVK